ncbi:MAG: HEAT repeat domain-containing protein, partial [Clostridiales bacterium]|nr:HEAT repeat domain-containing protein [Clostridiales bacterium]
QLLAWLWKLAPDGEILPLLVDLLGNGDEAVRVAAAEALPLINDKRAIPYLAGALMQPQRYEPARVAEVLHGLGPASAVILTRLLPEMNSTSQETLLDALALFEPGYPLQPLLDCLNASEERVRAAAARVLEKNGARGAENINNVNAAAAQDAAPQPEGGLSDVV